MPRSISPKTCGSACASRAGNSKTATKDRHGHKQFLAYKGPKILLVNVEALSTVKAAKQLCTNFLAAGPTTMVIDESTTIKSHKAARTKFCLTVGFLAKKRRILSGLPTPQSPLDIHAQFQFIDPAILRERFEAFQARYAIMENIRSGGRLIPVVRAYQNIGELTDRMRPHSFRVRLDECYDMPEKMYLRRDIEMTAEQKRLYDEMMRYAVAELDNMERVTATVVLTQLLRLHQILAGHTRADDTGAIVDIPENKTAEMLDIVEKISGKAIVWAAYDADVKKITKALEDVYGRGSAARFWGGNRDTREDEERDFKTNPRCRFMVATAAAGGRGRTWDMANTMIYYSDNTFSLEHRMQSEERAGGVGKTQSIAFFDLVCRGTVEEKILAALRNKKTLSDAVMEDGYIAWLV